MAEMTDREVRQLMPLPEKEVAPQTRYFSDYAEMPNVVLLGDPGAGKTHLFRALSTATGELYLTTRSFLNLPKVGGGAILYIDALDERRAGRGDHDVIDAVVQKLFDSDAAKVRIACRAADWLGDTDLAAFSDYFDRNGGVTVVSLAALSADEQLAVLELQGVPDPELFRSEAIKRGLVDFLTNPQNLIMLTTAVKGGQWPASRKELFETATLLLLQEPNETRARSELGQFAPEELLDAAGSICAVRLISDVAGISLADSSTDPDFPTYRLLPFVNRENAAAALARRVFEAVDVERVDYAHRTIAEYLAAFWLARMVRGGLPLGRVRALIGIDGHPAAELRGLNAWLAVHLPEHAEALIDGDPYGVLTYGDAGALTPSLRKYLLKALAKLSEKDPWFRESYSDVPAVGALGRPDMVGAFQAILRSSDANPAIRTIVVDSLAAGTPPPEMQADLIRVVWRTDSSYAERSGAVDALTKMGLQAHMAVLQSYRSSELVDKSSLRLRAEIVTGCYSAGFGPADVLNLVSNVLASDGDLVGGSLWFLAEAIPLVDVLEILDAYPTRAEMADDETDRWRNRWEVCSLFERLLLRALREAKENLEPLRILGWLKARRSYQKNTTIRRQELAAELRRRPTLIRGLVDAFLENWPDKEKKWLFQHQFWEATFYVTPKDVFHEAIIAHLNAVPQRGVAELALYELGLSWCCQAPSLFTKLYMLADERPHLAEVRDRLTRCSIPGDHFKYKKRQAMREIAEGRMIAKNIEWFAKNRERIRSGEHLVALGWASRIYFDQDDPEGRIEPVTHLIEVLGEENAAAAIDGFLAVLNRTDFPTLSTVAELQSKNKWFEWWLVIIAGLDESWSRTSELDKYADHILKVALVIDLCHPTFNGGTNNTDLPSHGWKDATMSRKPELARDAYLAIARAKLEARALHIDGLHELLHNELLAPVRRNAVVTLLRDFPNAELKDLESLLDAALDLLGACAEILEIARTALSDIRLNEQQRDAWLAFAYLRAPHEFAVDVEARAMATPGMIWQLRDFSGRRRRGGVADRVELQVEQLTLIVHTAGRHFRNVFFPTGGWSGDTNEWDGAEFVRNLVNEISVNPSKAATLALEGLAADEHLETYRLHIRHALANQMSRRREAEYKQPDWPQAIASLQNAQPASVPDLHALLVTQLQDIASRFASGNTDIYKRFWNEDQYGRVKLPKPEESGRDILVDLLRGRLEPLGVIVEPEGHMAFDQRADISVALPGKKILVELKRDHHPDLWTAPERQLENYTRDPEASGYGVYGVFWYGEKRRRAIAVAPNGARPQTAKEMQEMLWARVPDVRQYRTAIVILDVSGSRPVS